MNSELKKIKSSEFFKIVIENEDYIQDAFNYIKNEKLTLKPSTKYSVLINDEPFPPKDFLRIIAKLQGLEIEEIGFNGGKANIPFEKLKYEIIGNDEYPTFNGSRLYPQIAKYQDAIDNTDWLIKGEIYKFHFLKWVEENLDFNNDTNQEIQDKISESQQIIYGTESNEKGVNFIQSIKRHQDDYLTIDDIEKLKNIILHSAPVNKENLTLSFNSFPKSSAFLCLFAPNRFMAYDGESIPAYEFLSQGSVDIKAPKRNFKAFRFYQIFYNNIKKQLKNSHLDVSVFMQLLEVETLTELHWNFITQDFLLYVTRKIMGYTLQKKYDDFIDNEVPESWDWYKSLSKYSEIMKIIKERCSNYRYNSYSELNKDFKKLVENDAEDFLQRYLFESNNGFSTIRNQLIKLNQREVIFNKIDIDFNLLKNILVENNIEHSFNLTNNLIDGNNWTVIYRFLRALYPENFTSVDSPDHFKKLAIKLNSEHDIVLSGENQIDKNKEVLELINFEDIYKAQIFFWIYKEDSQEETEISNDNNQSEPENMMQPLNQILYGPPGTGKTYETKKIAVEIIENRKYSDSIKDREIIIDKYESLVDTGQIHFTTFHQSLSYEDFIEGIKPVFKNEIEIDSEFDNTTGESSIEYEIKDGIFKNICQLAEGVKTEVETLENIDFENKDFYKMSLGGKSNLEKHKWSIKNNLIFLGWGNDKNFTHLKDIENWKDFRDKFKTEFPELVEESKYVIQAVYIFQKMKIGDIIIVSKGNHIIDAIGVIESEYFYDESQEIDNYQFRKVKWLSKDMNISPEIFLKKSISQQTIYKFDIEDIKLEAFDETFKKHTEIKLPKNYVLIIDEINRGNISSIFGELITLIEPDKRIGSKESIRLILPYSKKTFAVPDNLYIIGTMNTADRSVEALDTALRRRFSFNEVSPNTNIILEKHPTAGKIEGDLDIALMLDSINRRIDLLINKDHKIGHSYFLKVLSFSELKNVFNKKIIPLLEEYFYGDYGKIGLVLGNQFVDKISDKNKTDFADFNYDDKQSLREKVMYKFIPVEEWTLESFISIYNNSIIKKTEQE